MKARYLSKTEIAKLVCVFLSVFLIQLPLLGLIDSGETQVDEETSEAYEAAETSDDGEHNINPDEPPEANEAAEASDGEQDISPDENEAENEIDNTDSTIDSEESDNLQESRAEEIPPPAAATKPNMQEASPDIMPELEDESEIQPESEYEVEPESEISNEPTLGAPVRPAASGLSPNERIVTSFTELRDALGVDNGVNKVYFGADIIMSAGINIHGSKTDIVIDGFNPLDPGQTEPYRLTDYTLLDYITETIYVNSNGVKSLLIRDLNITGRNYYGPFSAFEMPATSGLVITYMRVNYNGPQIGHHRNGLIRFVDCDIQIHGNNPGSPNQEFSEAKRLQFEGRNTINTVSGLTSIFWHPLGGSFEILDDASLTLTATNMGSGFGVFYSDSGTNQVNISIGQRAVFDVTINGVLGRQYQVSLYDFRVAEDGAFRLATTKAASESVMIMDGDITVEENASFIINGHSGANRVLLEQTAGGINVSRDATFHLTTPAGYSTLLSLHGRPMICDDPASVLLYNPGGRLIQSAISAGSLSVLSQQLNYWTAAGNGGFDNPPNSFWRKLNDADISVKWNLATGASGNISVASHNYETSDSLGAMPDAANFNMVSGRTLSFGRLYVVLNTPTEQSATITGETAPGAAVRASFTRGGVDYTLPDVIADANGVFSIPTGVSLTDTTNINVRSSFQYLFAEASTSVTPIGKVEFVVPNELGFFTTELAPKTQTVHRLKPNWNIMVSDTRGAGSNWRLYVRELQTLTAVRPPGASLNDALIFVNDSGVAIPIGSSGTLSVRQHTTSSDNDLTLVQWAANRGILARIAHGAAFAEPYAARLEWILVDAP